MHVWRLGFPKAKKAMLTHLFLLLTCSIWKLIFIMAREWGLIKPQLHQNRMFIHLTFDFFVQKCFWISLCTLSSDATVNADHSTFPILINDVDCSRPFGLVFLLFAIDWCHMPAVSVDSGTAPNQGHWEKRASNLCYGSISLSSQPQAGPHRAKAQKT